jgi:hypothetical protein
LLDWSVKRLLRISGVAAPRTVTPPPWWAEFPANQFRSIQGLAPSRTTTPLWGSFVAGYTEFEAK